MITNHVFFIGHFAKDPESSTTANGVFITRLTLAVNRMKKDKADFLPITFFGRMAEVCAQYGKKGSKAAISGRLEINTTKDETGNYKNYWNIIGEEIHLLSRSTEKTETATEKDPLLEEDEGESDMSIPDLNIDLATDIPF